MIQVTLNGSATSFEERATVAEALRATGGDPSGRGLAIAVNGEVVPRSAWGDRRLAPGDRIEILAATQGG